MSLAASKRPSGGTALRVLRERVSSTSSRSVLYPFVDRTGPSTDSNKAADPAAIQSKMATQVEFRYGCVGWSQRPCPLAQGPINAGKNNGISGLMDRLRPSARCVERAQGSGIVSSVCLRRQKGKLIYGTLWQTAGPISKFPAGHTHFPLHSGAGHFLGLMTVRTLPTLLVLVQFGRKETVFDEHDKLRHLAFPGRPGMSDDR